VLLVALAAAASTATWPRWWAFVAPAAVAVVGLVRLPLPTYEKLNADSPVAMLNDGLLRLATSATAARILLVQAVLVAILLVLVVPAFLPRRWVAIAAAALAAVVLPLESVYAFDRLFRVNGTNGLPITLDQGVVFDWIDRAVGPGRSVSMLRYPVDVADFNAGVQYWWDVEFWNESVVNDAYVAPHTAGPSPWLREFDPRTGRALHPQETQYVVVHQTDVRFRLAGRQVLFDRGAYVVEPDRPWRSGYLTDGIYGDGWTRPHRPAQIRVFANPGQKRPLKRFVTIALASPLDGDVTIASNADDWKGKIGPDTPVERLTTVCVPPGGYGTIDVSTPLVSNIYRDPTRGQPNGENDRPAGILVRILALADESTPVKRCGTRGTPASPA
jgi:hypothetical protein